MRNQALGYASHDKRFLERRQFRRARVVFSICGSSEEGRAHIIGKRRRLYALPPKGFEFGVIFASWLRSPRRWQRPPHTA